MNAAYTLGMVFARFHRITIIHSQVSNRSDINERLRWFGASLGLFGERDRDSSCFRVFIELLKSSRANKPISSTELAYRTGLSRGTIVHHLNTLMEAGIVVADANRYALRVGNLELLVDEIKKDTDRAFSDLRLRAKELDEELG